MTKDGYYDNIMRYQKSFLLLAIGILILTLFLSITIFAKAEPLINSSNGSVEINNTGDNIVESANSTVYEIKEALLKDVTIKAPGFAGYFAVLAILILWRVGEK